MWLLLQLLLGPTLGVAGIAGLQTLCSTQITHRTKILVESRVGILVAVIVSL